MIYALKLDPFINGEGESLTKLPEPYNKSNHTITVRPRKKNYPVGSVDPYGIIGLQWTATVDPLEVFSMEEIRRDITDLKVSVAEMKKDVKYISKNIEPIPGLTIDVAVIKNTLSQIAYNTKSIRDSFRNLWIAVAGGIIIYLIVTYILPLFYRTG